MNTLILRHQQDVRRAKLAGILGLESLLSTELGKALIGDVFDSYIANITRGLGLLKIGHEAEALAALRQAAAAETMLNSIKLHLDKKDKLIQELTLEEKRLLGR